MSMDKLKIEVLLAAINKATGPLKAIQTGSSETAKALKAAKDQLKSLNEEQKRIDGFRNAARGIAIHRQELAKAEERVRTIAQAMKAATFPTKEMQKAFKEATQEANHLKGNITRLSETQERLRRELASSGADTHKLASYQKELKSQMAGATSEVEKQAAALAELGKRQQRLHAARATYDKAIEQRNKLAGAGATTTAAGVAMSLPIMKAVKDYASFEDAMMGVARQVEGARDANGQLTSTYYEMAESIKVMSERIPLATNEIAAIVEAGARMGIQGKDNLLTYAQTTAVMATAFDLPVDQVGDDVAKIAALYKVPIKSISELGDVINYLDDSALAKGGDIIDVMKRIAGTADTVGMKYRDAAALASTFLSLGANSEVASSASNAMMTNLSIATMQPARFQEGLDMLHMNSRAIQSGMTKDATGTILKVMDAIKKLPQEKQLEATTRLFGKEFGDDAAKLASNIGEYRRQLELVNAEKAKGSMDREAEARNSALSAQYIMMKNTVFGLSTELGQALKPALVSIMTTVADVLRGIRDWTKAHPELTANLVKGAAVIAVIVTLVGGLMLAVSAVLGPLAIMKLSFAMIGIKGAGALTMVKLIGQAILWLGRALLMNPIGLAITAIVGGAYLIYKHWEPIKTFFSDLWDGVTAKFNAALSFIKDKLSILKPLLSLLPAGRLALAAVSAMGGTAAAQPVIDNRPPITAAAYRSSAPVFAPSFKIIAAPGMDAQQVGDIVSRKVDAIYREEQARKRSRMTDSE